MNQIKKRDFFIHWLIMVVACMAATVLCDYFIFIAKSVPNEEKLFLKIFNLIWNGGITIAIIVKGIRYFIWIHKLNKK